AVGDRHRRRILRGGWRLLRLLPGAQSGGAESHSGAALRVTKSPYGFVEVVGAFFAGAFFMVEGAGFFVADLTVVFVPMVLVETAAGFLVDAALVAGALAPDLVVVAPAGVMVAFAAAALAAAICAAAHASVESILLAGSAPV